MNFYRYLFLFLILIVSPASANQLPDEPVEGIQEEEVYLSLRYQGVIDEIVVAYYDGENIFLPLTEIFELFAINYKLNPTSFSVSGYFVKEDAQYVLNFSNRVATFKDKTWSIDANEYLVKEVDYFVSPDLLKKVFDLDFIVDLSRLALKLETKEKLPIITRFTRRHKEELRKKYGEPDNLGTYKLLFPREPKIIDGALFDYNLFTVLSPSNTNTNLNLNMGGELLHGDIQGTLISRFDQEQQSIRGSDIKWRYVDESIPWFSTITLGQQSTNGLTNQTFQGAHLTNEPLVPRRSYDTYAIDGTTEPDAEVELYQNNRLVEVIKASDVGYYRFMVPLNYGISDYKIRIYAKQGRVIELDKRIQIPFNFLPVKEVRYQVAAGRLASGVLPWQDQQEITTANVGVGVSSWLTVGGGVEYIQNNNADVPVFYGKISSRVAGDILLGLDAVPQNYFRMNFRGVGPNSSSIYSEYTYFVKKNLYNLQGFKHKFTTNLFYPFTLAGMRFTGQGSTVWTNLQGGNQLSMSANVNQFLNGFRFRYGVREDHSYTSVSHSGISNLQLGVMYVFPRAKTIHPLIRGTYIRTDLSYRSSTGDMEEIQFQYIKQFNTRLQTQVMASRNLIRESTFFEIGLSWDLETLRSTSTVRSVRSNTSFSQTLRGSVSLDRPNGQFLWDNRQQVGRSGVSVRMYIDENNSGSYEIGEEIIPGNALTIEGGSARQITKSNISRLTQLQPYRRYYFRVNEARISNPMLVSSTPRFSIVTDPNTYKQVDVALFTSGIVEGRVDRVQAEGVLPVSGLRIHIHRTDGSMEKTLRTFADGSYYSMEIPPGNYEAWVDDSQLEFLGMISVPEKLSFTVISSPDGDYVEGLNFILE